jgi:hypothetical protein
MALENRSKPRQLVYLILVAAGFVYLVIQATGKG